MSQKDSEQLQQHVAGTYFSLRLGIAIIGIALPLLLWIGGGILDRELLRGSISAYYYSASLRDVFVGLLITVGVLLYLYKGFSTAENVALNISGVCAVGVALAPTSPPEGAHAATEPFHVAFAVTFFLGIAYVSVFRAADTLSLIRNADTAAFMRTIYRWLGAGMVASPAMAITLSYIVQPGSEKRSTVFFVEAVGVWVFASYWLVKTWEMRQTEAEQLAAGGKLRRAPRSPAVEKKAPGRLVQTEE